jgi:hypothetical protein
MPNAIDADVPPVRTRLLAFVRWAGSQDFLREQCYWAATISQRIALGDPEAKAFGR